MSSGLFEATAYVGLGSNLGDRLAWLRRAVRLLAESPSIDLDPASDAASLYETSPVGGPAGQPLYLNSALRLRTKLSPHVLLSVLLAAEASLGRVRAERHGPRAIDMDLLLYGQEIIQDHKLTIPHPRLHERSFVLEPLAELAGDLRHPVLALNIAALAHQCRTAHEGHHQVSLIAGPTWALSEPDRAVGSAGLLEGSTS